APSSEIWRVGRGHRSVRTQEEWIFCADGFRPVADEATIGNPPRPGCSENVWVLHGELNLQPLFRGGWVNGAAPVRRCGPKYGSVLLLVFGGGVAVDQAVALDDMQRFAVGSTERINRRER